MSKQALEQMVNSINCTDKMVRLGVDHRRDFPPRGRLENAELMEKDGYYYVEADFVEYEKTEIVNWNENLIIQYFEKPFQFAEVEQDENFETSISIDPQNFNSFLEAKNFSDNLKANGDFDIKVDFHGRKSEITDPEIIFKFANTYLFYQLVKPTVKKIGEKIADGIADKMVDQSKKLKKFIEQTLKELFYRCIPKARPVTIVFDLPGKPHIELIARTRDEKLVLKGLQEKKLSKIRQEIEELNKNVKIAKAQFVLSDKGKWTFNYLITDTGQTIGKKITFKRREQRLSIISGKRKNGR
jgi:hypothetical protein